MVKVEVTLEYPTGLTEEAIEAQFRDQYGHNLESIEVQKE